jgi:RNA recognition motif-containing protein
VDLFLQVEDIHLVREEDTGKSRGFAFCKYEDARSCVLAVDNFVGVKASAILESLRKLGGFLFI